MYLNPNIDNIVNYTIIDLKISIFLLNGFNINNITMNFVDNNNMI